MTNPNLARASRFVSALMGPQFIENEDGYLVRQWGNGYEDYVTDNDVHRWLKGQRVIEDLREGLEFVREGYIQSMIVKGFLRKDPAASYYWITAKAAERFKLEPVMGCKFPA